MAKVCRFDFKRVDVYQGALRHFEWTVEVSKRVPWKQKVVINQMLRASLSGLLNTGEAAGRNSSRESAQHLRYARGSVAESAAMLDALSVMGVIGDDEYNRQEELLMRIGAMLTAMIRKKTGRR